jgi:putative oxidoreductase
MNAFAVDENENRREPAIDWGLLLLRGVSLFLASTFGVQKLWRLVTVLRSGDPLASWGLVQFVREMGFPMPAFLTVCATLNESIVALLVAFGLVTRLAAASVALNMAAALYISLTIGEEPLRAALYFVMFVALVFTGPGRFSIDHLLESRSGKLSAANR